jgi:hypothetical protein
MSVKSFTIQNKVCTITNKILTPKVVLPPIATNIVRVRTFDGLPPYKTVSSTIPTPDKYTRYTNATLVDGTQDIYDVFLGGTDFTEMFYGSWNITEVLGSNTEFVTNMDNMFESCIWMSAVRNLDTHNVSSMNSMFYDCSILDDIQMFDTSNVTGMSGMFGFSELLHTIPQLDTHNVTDMTYMFSQCLALTHIPVLDTSNVSSMVSMFNGCWQLSAIPLLDTSNAQDVNSMCLDCSAVCTGTSALYSQMTAQTTPPTSYASCFENCGVANASGLAELALIPDDWK